MVDATPRYAEAYGSVVAPSADAATVEAGCDASAQVDAKQRAGVATEIRLERLGAKARVLRDA